jgi:hypothetical protein
MVAAILATACGRSETEGFTLHIEKVERVNGCHVILYFAGGKDGTFVGMTDACGVPSSALTEETWWGDQPRPLSYTVGLGDCLNLNSTLYCLKNIEVGKSASFKAKYKMRRKGHVIEKIRDGRKYVAD